MIAAVAGYALGGGCELAMICNLIIAAENASFGQSGIKLSVIPGIGGSQRLTRAVGKSKAMEMILSGRTMSAEEAGCSGLVAKVVPLAELMEDALATARTNADMSKPIAMLAKESVNRAYEMSLVEDVQTERRFMHSCFAIKDQKEGMHAFVEKCSPVFLHR
ncbi:enoyl-CoA hydratase/carnithine racemase [Arthrobacter ginsengisoli]|uniref:Enoyl-CoA hydratase/carnithine racemase n=1 Tax=Arthrobacter ginsengisoli TaxID=1356565 RepID=A0ABU1UI86_9MICC|nr:enoyl-CoA hydratase/carnithine racemase [Arthrobacter ginsengisoli]